MTIETPWGIGSYRGADGSVHSVQVSQGDFERDVEVAASRLRGLGFGSGDVVLVVASVNEGAQMAPLQRAARRLGGISCTAECSRFDSPRTAALMEHFSLKAVFGLDEAVLAGMEEAGQLGSLGRCSTLVARSDALARLNELGLVALELCLLGPALAVECTSHSGAHVGASAWTVESDGGQLCVQRAMGSDDLRRFETAITGQVIEGACDCGSDDPRVRVKSVTLEPVVGLEPTA